MWSQFYKNEDLGDSPQKLSGYVYMQDLEPSKDF